MKTGRASIARWLESDAPRPLVLKAAARVWARASAHGVCRPLALPEGVRTIGVGGATLGGSCKTPFAIALARCLAGRGEQVVLVGHAYRARPRFARVVTPSDDLADVGDEALFAARSLAPIGVEVIVAPSRQLALDFAARRASCIVFDGVLQARPRRFTRSVLLLDATAPWGNGRCPPAGDLRAPRAALVAAADVEVTVAGRIHRILGFDGSEARLYDFAGTVVGLILAIARPDRVVRTLAAHGLRPAAVIALADHACPTVAELERAAFQEPLVAAWLTTPKCAVKLPPVIGRSPVFVLDHRVEVPDAIVDGMLSPLGRVLPPSPAPEPW